MISEQYRHRIHNIIYEAETREGKLFDVVLLILIVLSIFFVSLETVPSINASYGKQLYIIEWILTIIFTIEYGLRLWSINKPYKYAFSFYGIIDLISIMPTYLSLFLVGSHSLIIIRSIRLLRVFRIFKMARFINQGEYIVTSLRASIDKIIVFLYTIMLLVCIFGAIMYLVEGPTNPAFDSIPRSIYWSIVTLTTVGFGDITPQTSFGQFLSAIIMILGYGVIAVPTGIVSSEMVKNRVNHEITTESCRNCAKEGHDKDAIHCKFCGHILHDPVPLDTDS